MTRSRVGPPQASAVRSTLQRWLSRLFGTDQPPAAATASERRGTHPSASDAALASAARAAIGARRPLIDASGAVVGFEFRMADDAARYLKRESDAPLRVARVTALLSAAYGVGKVGRKGLARLPAHWLVHATGVDVGPGVLVGLEFELAVGPVGQTPVELEYAVLTLRASGAQVGWELGFDVQLKPDFVLLRQGALSMSSLLDSMATWPAALRGVPVLVTDISDVEELEMALYYGVTYACGALDREAAAAEPAGKNPVPPEVRRVARLLNQLASGAETDVIVEQIKGDVGLSYRLLSRINSASYAQLARCISVEQAVLLLGRLELHRWLSMLLVQFAGSRRAALALQEMTLWRSRLLELMAIEAQEAAADQFFTLGLASMLGQLLKISQADVVDTLNLPPLASQALVEQAGPWHVYLQLAKHLETQTLDPFADLAARFGGTARLAQLSDDAWRWAAEQSRPIDAGDADKPA